MIELLEQQKKLTANQWKLICTANVADLLDFFDFFLIGYVTAALTKEWSLPYWQGGSRTAQRPAGATRSRKTEREVFQPQRPCDEGLVVAIFSRRKPDRETRGRSKPGCGGRMSRKAARVAG